MPTKIFTAGLPYPPLIRVDQSGPLEPAQLAEVLEGARNGWSICVRSESGEPNRGGYFFHVRRDADHFILSDFENISVTKPGGDVIKFDLESLCAFVNHCTGALFSEKMLYLSQSEINFRSDPEDA